jgi:hypothetical protein
MLNRKVSEWSNTECKFVDKGRVTEHVGRSLYVANETVQIMSDVWDTETFLYSIRDDGTLSRDCVGYCDNPELNPVYEIDATEEAFELYRAKQEADKYESLVHNTNADYANPAFKGRVVKVVRGRNAPVGKVGKVVVVIERPYGMGYRSVMRPKLGIALSAKTVEKVMPNGKVFQNHADMIWVWAHNCEVEVPQTADLAKCRQMAQDFAKSQVKALRARQEEAFKYHAPRMQGYRRVVEWA